MENTNKPLAASEYKSYSLETTPWYFGVYLNLARLNLGSILSEVYSKYELSGKMGEEKIKESFLCDKRFTEQFKNENINLNGVLLSSIRMMPFMRYFFKEVNANNPNDDFIANPIALDDTLLSELTLFCKEAFEVLWNLRNNYSHYFIIKSNETRQSDVPIREVALSDNFIKTLNRIYQYGCLEQLHYDKINQQQIEFLKQPYISTLVGENKRFTNRGMVFFINLFLDRENAFRFMGKVEGFKNTSRIEFVATRKIYSYFCVLLPRERFVSANTLDSLQLDILSYLHKVPCELFRHLSQEDKKSYIPKLDDETKNLIVENSLSKYDELENFDDFIDQLSSQDRKNNRFTYYALRLLEELECFGYYFELSLGNIVEKEYLKNVAGIEIERKRLKKIKVFGKLADYQSLAKINSINTLLSPSNYHSLFTDLNYAPKYNIVGNKIGLYSKHSCVNGELNDYKPEAYLSINELPKLLFLSYYNDGANDTTDIIRDYLLNTKTALIGIQNKSLPLLYCDAPLEVRVEKENFKLKPSEKDYTSQQFEQKISDNKRLSKKEIYRLKYFKYVSEVRERKALLKSKGYDLKLYPQKLIYKSLNIKTSRNSSSFKDWIKEMRQDCKRRVNQINNGMSLKAGTMATDLAKDIIHHIIDAESNSHKNKDTIKGKITAAYYNQLQKSLAYYGLPEYKQLFLKLCNELHLLDRRKGHPFLKLIEPDRINSITDFYKKYYNEKGAKSSSYLSHNGRDMTKPTDWLYTTFYLNIDKEDKSTEIRIPTTDELKLNRIQCGIPYSYYRKYNKKSNDCDCCNEGWHQHKQRESVKLPTNLFDELVYKNQDFGTFSKLVESISERAAQPFYSYTRGYEVKLVRIVKRNREEKTFNCRVTNGIKIDECYKEQLKEAQFWLKGDDVKAKHKFKTIIDQNEKQIRYQLLQDRILCYCLGKLMNKVKSQSFQFNLSDFDYSNKSPLDQEDKIMIPIVLYKRDGTVKSLFKIVDTRKRKDYAKLKNLVYDKRIKRMCELYADTQNIVKWEDIKNELEQYEIMRLNVFEMLFKLEESIINTMSTDEYDEFFVKKMLKDIMKDENKGLKPAYNVVFEYYTKYLSRNNYLQGIDIEFLKEVRKSLCHNVHPDYDKLKSKEIESKMTAIIESINKKE